MCYIGVAAAALLLYMCVCVCGWVCVRACVRTCVRACLYFKIQTCVFVEGHVLRCSQMYTILIIRCFLLLYDLTSM